MRESPSRVACVLVVCASLGCNGAIDDTLTGPADPDPGLGEPAGRPPNGKPGIPGAPAPGETPSGSTPGAPPASPTAPLPPPGSTMPLSCQPGVSRPTLRRLTSIEYRNTVRELFPGLTMPALALPSDDKVAGFTAVVDALSDDVLPAYIDAAYAVAAAAAATPKNLMGACDVAKTGEEACVRQMLDSLGARAWRRPLDTAEKDAVITRVFRPARASAGMTGALEHTTAWLLLAPDFLYHSQVGVPAPAIGAGVRQLTDPEIASSLSYLLHRRPPDEALMKAALAGELAQPAKRLEHAKRLLADDKALEVVWGFQRQWLHIDHLDGVTKDAKLFPQFDEALRDAMEEESRRFSAQTFKNGGGSIRDLLLGRTTFLDGKLATLYGATKSGTAWAPHEWSAGSPRVGILGQASFLAAQATPTDVNAVVFRGVAIRTGLLCLEVPPPPADVDVTSNADRLTTLPCSACHALIDPIGQALDNFDSLGRLRPAGSKTPVSTTGAIKGTVDIDGPVNGLGELAQALARSKQTNSCLAIQWLRFALARPLVEADACLVRAIENAQAENPSLSSTILAYVGHPDFILRREPATGGTCQ